MVNKRSKLRDNPVPQRLEALRNAAGYDFDNDFAENFLGISEKRYANMASGAYPVSHKVAQLIVDKFPGCTIDWIWNGVENGLSTAFRQRLGLKGGAANARTTPSRYAKPKDRSGRTT